MQCPIKIDACTWVEGPGQMVEAAEDWGKPALRRRFRATGSQITPTCQKLVTGKDEMRSRILQLLVVPVLAGAMLLSGTNAAQAASATTAPPAAAAEAKAIQVGESVARSLQATGNAVFTAADGTVHRMSLTNGTLFIDGQAGPFGSSAGAEPLAPASIWCNIKVAAAVAVIATLSVTFIGWMIAGVGAATAVSIAGITLTASQWTTVMALITSGTALAAFLRTVLC